MTPRELLEKYSAKTGWDQTTWVALLCEYLEQHVVKGHIAGFDRFLNDKFERETLLDTWKDEVAEGDTHEGFDSWLLRRRREKANA